MQSPVTSLMRCACWLAVQDRELQLRRVIYQQRGLQAF